MCCWNLWPSKRAQVVPSYPKEIIPNVKYVIQINIDKLINEMDFYICRRLKGCLDENTIVFNGKKRLRLDAIENIINMSTNLLGAKFDANKHIQFSPTGEARNDWDGRKIEFPHYSESFQIIANCSYVAYKGRKLHNIPFPYLKNLSNYEKKKAKVLGIDLGKINASNEYQCMGTIRLAHKPTMLNYWHVVMDLYPQDSNDPISDKSSRWKKNMVSFVLEKILTVDFEVNPNNISKIRKSFYVK